MPNPDHVTYLAEQLLPQFIPKDASQSTLSFQFTMVPNTTYRVNYTRKKVSGKDVWELVNYEEVKEG